MRRECDSMGLGFSYLPPFDSSELPDSTIEFLDFPRNFSQVRPVFRIHQEEVSSPEFRLFFDMTDSEYFYRTISMEMDFTSFIRDINLGNCYIVW